MNKIEDENFELVLHSDDKNLVKGGRLKELLEYLINKDEDKEFQNVFLSTYSTFTSHSDFFLYLIETFNLHSNNFKICQRVLEIFLDLFKSRDSHNLVSNDSLMELFNNFISSHKNCNMNIEISSLFSTINEKIEGTKRNIEMEKTNNIYSLGYDIIKCKILDYCPKYFAEQLTAFEYHLFQRITPGDVCKFMEMKTRKDEVNIHRLISHFNQISMFFQHQILSQKKKKEKIRVIVHLIKIAEHLFELKSANGMMEIISAFQSPPIHRLEEYKQGRSFDVNYLEKIERIATRERGYKSLRKFQNEESLPLLPFFGMTITDLTFIFDGNSSSLLGTEMINYNKRRMVHELIKKNFLKFQDKGYDFITLSPKMIDLFNNLNYWEDDYCYYKSILQQPRVERINSIVNFPPRTPKKSPIKFWKDYFALVIKNQAPVVKDEILFEEYPPDQGHHRTLVRKFRTAHPDDLISLNSKTKLNALYSLSLLTYQLNRLSLDINHKLILTNNDIQTLPEDLYFPCWQTIYLSLHSNLIKSIEKYPLRGFSNLTTLNLSQNRISRIILTNLKHLEEIDLGNNCLSRFIKNLKDKKDQNGIYLSELPSLRILKLKFNYFKVIPPNCILQSCPQLTQLDLSFNQLQFISPFAFDNLTKLTHLDLSYNSLTSASNSLYRYYKPNGEDEKGNIINDIFNKVEKSIFDQLISLQELKLNCNKITWEFLSLENVSNLRNLKELNLSNNHKMRRIPKEFAISNLISLERIHLNGCRYLSNIIDVLDDLNNLPKLKFVALNNIVGVNKAFDHPVYLRCSSNNSQR